VEPQQYQELLKLLHQLLKDQTAAKELTDYDLTAAKREIQFLRDQLAMKDALLTSKEETLALLRASYNHPN